MERLRAGCSPTARHPPHAMLVCGATACLQLARLDGALCQLSGGHRVAISTGQTPAASPCPAAGSWQSLPPPGARAAGAAPFDYSGMPEGALAIQAMGYDAYRKFGREVRPRACGEAPACKEAEKHLPPPGAGCSLPPPRPPPRTCSCTPAASTNHGTAHVLCPPQADPATCTFGCGAMEWGGVSFGGDLVRYLCATNASADPLVCTDAQYNQVR